MQTTLTDDLEYPRPASPKCYALWCPLLDCFLWVHTDLDLLREIQLLSSSKILTVPVELDINLLLDNVLDNFCCTGWTVQDPDLINFTFVYQKPNQVWPCAITPALATDTDPAQKIQSWIRFLIKWMTWVAHHEQPNRVKNFICAVMDLPMVSLKQKIYKILLLSHDQDTAEQHIQQIVKDHD
jgi:hypothetical protein